MIRLQSLGLEMGTFRLQGIDLTIPTGQYAVLMGKTGCGKSSILEAIAGLRPLRAGRILLHDRDVTDLPVPARGVGYVPQDLALFPTRTVRRHLSFALELRRWPWSRVMERVLELASLLGIMPLLDRSPKGLSGGEAQRVALGRALSFQPSVLLLDEPLSALDEDTREEMVRLLRSVQRLTGVTVLHVTHSRREAEALADLRFRLENGILTEEAETIAPRDSSRITDPTRMRTP